MLKCEIMPGRDLARFRSADCRLLEKRQGREGDPGKELVENYKYVITEKKND